MVDGTYQSTTNEDGELEWTYIPRSADELTKIENLVKSAVNFVAGRGDKVEVVNIPFETNQMTASEDDSLFETWLARLGNYKPYLKYTFLSLFLILTFFFVVQPLIRWLTTHTVGEAEMLHQLPRTVGELETEYGSDAKPPAFKEQVSQLITQDNDASVGVVRDWLKENKESPLEPD